MEVATEYNGSSPAKDKLLLVGNMACAVDHLLEASISQPFKADEYMRIAKEIDIHRTSIMKSVDIPEELWCVYKHLAMARVQAQELFKAGTAPTEDFVILVNDCLVQLFGSDYEACATCRDDKGTDNGKE